MKQFTLRIVGMLTAVLLTIPAFAQLSGTYTIDPAGTGTTNYASFTAAAAALTTSGVSGPVTFNVAAGTYTEQVTIAAITGSSTTNTVTFQKAPTATGAAVLTFAPTLSTDNFTLRLSVASNIVLKDLTLANTTTTGQTMGGIIEYTGTCANISFMGNTFNGNAGASTSSAYSALRYGSLPSTGYASGKWLFINNTFNNVSSAAYVYGSSLVGADSVRAQGNTFNVSYYGVYTTYAKTAKIVNNTVNGNLLGFPIGANVINQTGLVTFSNNTVNNAAVGFQSSALSSGVSSSSSVVIDNNSIQALNYGIFAQNSQTTTFAGVRAQIRNNRIVLTPTSANYGILVSGFNATASAPSEIVNNTISMTGGYAFTVYGIYAYHLTNANTYHNTVYVTAGSATASRALYVAKSTSTLTTIFATSGLNIVNNIFVNTSPGYAAEIASPAALAMITNMSNNVYSGNALNPFRYNAINAVDLASWQTATTKDAGSVSGAVYFYGASDLHVQNAIANNMGALVGVTTDMDGQTRSTSTPDAGADEYTPMSCIAMAVTTISGVSSTGATAAWTTTNTPASYKIRYKTSAATAWTTTTSTSASKTLSGLTPYTTYQVQVKEFCTATDSSIWGSTVSFTTAINPNWTEPFTSYLPGGWGEAVGRATATTVFTNTSASSWGAANYGNVPANGMSARVNIWSTGHFHWLTSPSVTLPATGNYAIEFDAALTPWNGTGSTTLGADDTIRLVVSTDNGATWSSANTVWMATSATTISNTGQHVVIPVPVAMKGLTVKFGLYSQTTVSNADNDFFVDNFGVNIIATCPLTAVPTIPNQTSCGPTPVTFTATWANTTQQSLIWTNTAGQPIGAGASFTTAPITASTTQTAQLIAADNTVAAMTGGPNITLTNPAGGFGNFSNGMWINVLQPMILDSVTVKANLGTVNFQVRISQKAGTHSGNTGAELMLSNPISVTSATATGELKRVYVGLALTPGAYYVNMKYLAGTTGALFRSTAMPTGQTYPMTVGTVATIDSVQLGTTGNNVRVYYLFNWKASKACLGPVVTANATYAPVPSTAMPYTVDFNTGLPCNWTKSSTSGAQWGVVASYGTAASSLNGSSFAFLDDDAPGSSTITSNGQLVSPMVAALGYDTLKLEFDQYWRKDVNEKGYVEVYAPNAAGQMTWIKLDSMTTNSGAWAAPVHKMYNITAMQSNNLQVRFRYEDFGAWGWWWAIDNFKLSGTQSQTGNVRVQVITDIFGTEVSWKIKNTANKLTYASRGPWTDVTPYNVAACTHIDTVALPVNGTYEFRIMDSYGDGLWDGTNTGTYIAEKLCSWGDVLIKSGSGAFVNDPGGSTANVPSWDSAVFNMGCAQPATYLVKVNMNQQTVSANGVHIAGNFQGWNPATTAMTDANGDGVYEYTINTTVGAEIEYKFINGTAWGVDESVPTSCRYKNSWNRGDSITSVADTAATVCFAECSDCSTNVTFQVNMSKVAVSSNGVHIAGNFQGWNPGATALTDANGDSIYEVTVSVPSGMNLEFKYINGNAWGVDESVPTACRVSGSWNRGYSATYVDDSLDVVCFAQCTNCTVDVTLVVDMNRELPISADGVHVAGNFQGWNPATTALTDANGDNVFEATVQVPINTTANYKFINGNSWASGVESLDANDGSCVVNDGGGNYNRSVAVAVADITQDSVCFGRCVICGMNVDEQMGRISVFPNPTTGAFTIERGIASGNVAITVMNVQGQVIETAEWVDGDATLRLDASNYAEGVYFVRMTTDAGSSTLRVAVQR